MDRLLIAAEALSVVAAAAGHLDSAIRSRLNADLSHAGLDGNRSFHTVGQGLSAIGEVLAKHGLEWDSTLSAHLFMGDSGERTLDIAFSNETDPFSPVSITNSMVRVAWYKHQSGRYEITAYLS